MTVDDWFFSGSLGSGRLVCQPCEGIHLQHMMKVPVSRIRSAKLGFPKQQLEAETVSWSNAIMWERLRQKPAQSQDL